MLRTLAIRPIACLIAWSKGDPDHGLRSYLFKSGTSSWVDEWVDEWKSFSNRWICHAGQRIWLVGVDANEHLFASFDPPPN